MSDTQLLNEISKNINAMAIDVAVLKVEMKRNTDSIVDHVARSNALQDQNVKLQEYIGQLEKHINTIEKEVDGRLDKVEIPTKVIAYIGVPVGVIAGIVKILAELNIL